MNIAQLLVEAAERTPTAPAVRAGAHVWHTYTALAERAARLAGFLVEQGVRRGDRVAMFMTNHVAFLEVLYGILHVGAVAVPVNAKLHERELAFILEEAGANLCFVNADTASTAERAAAQSSLSGLAPLKFMDVDTQSYAAAVRSDPVALCPRDADDLAWLFFTSGTTGRPKGAMLTHRNLLLMTVSYLTEVDAVAANDCILHAAPLSHGSGMYNFAHVAVGAAQVIPDSHGFDPAEIGTLLGSLRGVSMFAAPTMVQRLVAGLADDGTGLPGLKLIVYGGGPMLVDQALRAINRFGPRLAQIYGQGECPMTITRLQRERHLDSGEPEVHRRRLASVGTPFHLVEVAIGCTDDLAVRLPSGQSGEILVRSPLVMAGYWSREAAGAGAPIGDWLATGDVGYFDAEGYLHLSDRSKDVIISGGTNIYSREIEDVLVGHPGVLEGAVIGRPNEEWGEEVVAVVGHGSGLPPTTGELDALCRASIAQFKRPRHYAFMPELPKNAYGKIEKTLLKAAMRSS